MSKTQEKAQPAAQAASPEVSAPARPEPSKQRVAQQAYIQNLEAGNLQMQGAPGGEEGKLEGQQETEPEKPGKSTQGLENYEAALGKFLGAQLYKAVGPAVAPAKVAKYADQAMKAAVGYLVGQFGKLDQVDLTPAQMGLLGDALHKAVQPQVAAFMGSSAGKELTGALVEWTDTHPREIATLAILAAVGMVVANAEIPALNAKYKLADNITASVEARLGTFRNISLEQIKARIEATVPLLGGTLKAHLEGGEQRDEQGGLRRLGAGLEWEDKEKGVGAFVRGEIDDRGGKGIWAGIKISF